MSHKLEIKLGDDTAQILTWVDTEEQMLDAMLMVIRTAQRVNVFPGMASAPEKTEDDLQFGNVDYGPMTDEESAIPADATVTFLGESFASLDGRLEPEAEQ